MSAWLSAFYDGVAADFDCDSQICDVFCDLSFDLFCGHFAPSDDFDFQFCDDFCVAFCGYVALDADDGFRNSDDLLPLLHDVRRAWLP